MFKFSLTIFAICVAFIITCSVMNIPIFMWGWAITIGSAGLVLKSWLAKVALDERLESMYGKYDRPSNGKPPEYHGL